MMTASAVPTRSPAPSALAIASCLSDICTHPRAPFRAEQGKLLSGSAGRSATISSHLRPQKGLRFPIFKTIERAIDCSRANSLSKPSAGQQRAEHPVQPPRCKWSRPHLHQHGQEACPEGGQKHDGACGRQVLHAAQRHVCCGRQGPGCWAEPGGAGVQACSSEPCRPVQCAPLAGQKSDLAGSVVCLPGTQLSCRRTWGTDECLLS